MKGEGKGKVLEILRETEDYVSGQEICELLGVSRTAVWKNINLLRQEGYDISSVNNRGYRLLQEPEEMGEAALRSRLHTRWLGSNILYEARMDSTNTQAKRLGEDGAPHGTLVVAEQQTAGRGRRGRTWESPVGNLYFSLLLRPEVLVDRASMITLLAAVALTRAMEKEAGVQPQIKWPNDIVLHGKKLCGILTESSSDLEYIHYVVVGIGININQETFPAELQAMASSLYLETGNRVNRCALLAQFLEQFEECYDTFLKTEDLSALQQEYNEKLVNRGREVKIQEGGQECIRKAVGIDSRGGLIVETPQGQQETIISGEVSVRGLYGYV